jgi:hypothetical protein
VDSVDLRYINEYFSFIPSTSTNLSTHLFFVQFDAITREPGLQEGVGKSRYTSSMDVDGVKVAKEGAALVKLVCAGLSTKLSPVVYLLTLPRILFHS